MLRRESTFSRTEVNLEKMGAYYTDVAHCKRIFEHFLFQGEVSVLEPSIGDATAVKAVTGATDNPNIKIFGVELNAGTVLELRKDAELTEVLHADFLTDVKISNGVFSFMFGNPPYMEDPNTGERCEKQFLEKATVYLTKGAICVWVVPYSVFIQERFIRSWCGRYTTEFLYRFDDAEFAKYKQICVIGRRKPGTAVFLPELERVKEMSKVLDDIPYIPEHYEGEKLQVYPSPEQNVTVFANRKFDREAGLDVVRTKGALGEQFNRTVTQARYVASSMGQPPIPLKPDSKYLCMVCGKGEGYVDCPQPHLQRGVVKILEEATYENRGEGSKTRQVASVTTSAKVAMTVIEQSGKITLVE